MKKMKGCETAARWQWVINESYGDKQGKEKKKIKAAYGWKMCNRERINIALFLVHLSVNHV